MIFWTFFSTKSDISKTELTKKCLSIPVSEEFAEAFYQNNQESFSTKGQIQGRYIGLKGAASKFSDLNITIEFIFPSKTNFKGELILSIQGPEEFLHNLSPNELKCGEFSSTPCKYNFVLPKFKYCSKLM